MYKISPILYYVDDGNLSMHKYYQIDLYNVYS